MKTHSKIYRKLFSLSIVALIVISIAFAYHLYFGKIAAFMLINQMHHPIFDQFFKYYTNFGDGLVWLPVFLFSYFYAKNRVPLVITNFALSSLFAVILKKLVYAQALRPSVLIQQGYHLHLVEGVKIHTSNSFPSGHTITAFAIGFTMILLVKKNNYIKYLFLIMAFLVGYSRVYLAQHYPIDVICGACIGIFSTYLSVYLHSLIKSLLKKRKRNLSLELS